MTDFIVKTFPFVMRNVCYTRVPVDDYNLSSTSADQFSDEMSPSSPPQRAPTSDGVIGMGEGGGGE
jgi:hypothetical protein